MSENKRMKVYKAKDGWRWHKWSSSDIVSESGQAYANKETAVEMAKAEIEGTEYRLEVED